MGPAQEAIIRKGAVQAQRAVDTYADKRDRDAYDLFLDLADKLAVDVANFLGVDVKELRYAWRTADVAHQRAIMAGDRESGITIMRMVERLDAGPMILQSRCPIAATDTGGALHDHLAEMGGAALVAGIDCLLAPAHEEREQAEDLVTYARKIERADRQIDWQRSAVEIERQIRALHPGPLASTSLAGITANIVTAEVMAESAGEPGQVTLKGETLEIHTGAGALRILTLQPAGKNVMAAREFINGYRQRLLA
jgi:methionyl-tRNA formyltransferase